ncbi:hypothetical protein HOE04_05030 [archaeon]|jgi:hypothetical protein|nr:hypothetical protein [archaeon]
MSYTKFAEERARIVRGYSTEALKDEIDLCRGMYTDAPTIAEILEDLFSRSSFRRMNQINLDACESELAIRNN